MTKHEGDDEYAHRTAFRHALREWRRGAFAVLAGAEPYRLEGFAWSHEGVRAAVLDAMSGDPRAEGQFWRLARQDDDRRDWLDLEVENADYAIARNLEWTWEWLLTTLSTEAFASQAARGYLPSALSLGRVALERGIIDHHPNGHARQLARAVEGRVRGRLLSLTASVRDVEWVGAAGRDKILDAWEAMPALGFAMKTRKGHGPSPDNGGKVAATRWVLTAPDKYVDAMALHLGRQVGRTGIHVRQVERADMPVTLATAARLKGEPLMAVLDVAELLKRGAGGLGPAGVTLAMLAASGGTAGAEGWVRKSWLEAVLGMRASTLSRHLSILRELDLVEVEWDRADALAGHRVGSRAPRLRGAGGVRLTLGADALRARLNELSVEGGARAVLTETHARIRQDRDAMWASADLFRMESLWCRGCGVVASGCPCEQDVRDWVEAPAA